MSQVLWSWQQKNALFCNFFLSCLIYIILLRGSTQSLYLILACALAICLFLAEKSFAWRNFKDMVNVIFSSSPLSFEDALALVHEPLDDLLAKAQALRVGNFGFKVELCAIINARSGQCDMNCAFCSQSRFHAANVSTFELLSMAEIHERLALLVDYPVKRVGIVTSGGALQDDHVRSLVHTLEKLPLHWQGRVCGSLGRLSDKALAFLYEAGLTRYHHNLESSERFYPSVCTTQKWQDRLATVYRAQHTGLEVCAGGLFGLGESWEDRIAFAFTLKEQGIHHVPMNFLYAHKGTPLEHVPALKAEEALRIIALFRHILPTATLRICGGRPHVLGARQKDIFAAGANALMTGDYLTTKGKGIVADMKMIEAQGLSICV